MLNSRLRGQEFSGFIAMTDITTNNGHKKIRSVQPFKQLYRTDMLKAINLVSARKLTHFDFVVIWALILETKKGNVITVTHQQIATKINASRVAVTRSFKRLKTYKLIDTNIDGELCLSSNLIWGGKITDRFWPFSKKEIR
jgi:Firmicute plasmid replication protein (RepL)